MLIFEIVDWILDNPGDATIWTILALVFRKVALSEIARVIQMGRDEELIWTREHVEQLVSQKWNGPAPFLKRARIQYTVKYYSYLLVGTPLEYLLKRRERKMNQTINLSVLFLAIAGAIKLILQPFGIDLSGVTDDSVNSIANGVGAIFAIIGIVRNNFKKKEVTIPVEPIAPKPQIVDPDNFIQG